MSDAPFEGSINAPIPGSDTSYEVSGNTDFLCMPEDLNNNTKLRSMSPLVVFAQPRTGSNLLFEMFGNRKELTNSFQLLNLYELFQPEKREEWRAKTKIYQSIANSCSIPNPIENATSTEEADEKLRISDSPILINAELDFQSREISPNRLLDLLASIPVKTRRAFYAFKIFEGHIHDTGFGTPGNVVDMVRERDENAKFLVLWRRRIIESFVSYKIAEARDSWVDKAVNVDTDKIHIDKVELERYIDGTRNYYLGVKQSLYDRNQDFEVVEYDKDLSSLEGQEAMVAKIESILGIDNVEPSKAKETIAHLTRKKQSNVDIKELVTNWDQVVSWGYGGVAEEWEDLFA